MDKEIPSAIELQLLTLVVVERSGRDVAKLYEKEVGIAISFGTLYTTFRRLREEGWVAVRETQDADGRIRNFRITAKGTKALNRGREYYSDLSRFGFKPTGRDSGNLAMNPGREVR